MQETIVWLDKRLPGRLSTPVGPKAASLCRLRRLGVKVPSGFFVTTVAFREHLRTGDLQGRIGSLLDRLDAQLDSVRPVLEQVRRLIVASPLADHLRGQIEVAYHRLDAEAVAVRSSANVEDLPGHSFAGQYETILGVRSLEGCLDAVKRCWASLWTERAYEYRRRNGIVHEQVEMAVIVQEQIEPDAAGVVFTLDPVTGSRSRIVIEACAGLGERLVLGHVDPDRIILRKKNLSLIRQTIPGDQGREPVLGLKSARRLARLARRIERDSGCPQDIEWAIQNGRIWFLQARPVTATPKPKSWADRQVWTNANTGEVLPDVVTPLTWSVVEILFSRAVNQAFALA